jgi:hypothetical protein
MDQILFGIFLREHIQGRVQKIRSKAETYKEMVAILR